MMDAGKTISIRRPFVKAEGLFPLSSLEGLLKNIFFFPELENFFFKLRQFKFFYFL